MKKFCVIGLGNFGFHVAKTLFEEGHEVVAIDRNKDRIQKIKDSSSQAILGDATNIDLLKSLGLNEMDAVVVSTGDLINYSILITLHLKELEVRNVFVKAVSEDHGRVLEKVGADQIIFPEKDTAIKLAKNLSTPNILDYIPLTEEFAIVELSPTRELIGKSLAEAELRSKYKINVIAVKEIVPDRFTLVPPADFIIKDSDILIVIGEEKDIRKIKEKEG